MRFFVNHGRAGAIVPVVTSILMWTACGAFAASPAPAPTGHRQPNVTNVPPSVLRDERAFDADTSKIDTLLNICRGC